MSVVQAISKSDAVSLAKACLRTFRAGNDTMKIAKKYAISEARASKLVWAARCWEKGLPADFDHRGSIRRIAK